MTTDERAEAILVSCRERLDRGEAVDIESLVREHPDLAARLRRGLASLARLDRAFRNDDAADDETPGATLVGRALGPWRLLSVLGSGGMGTVFLAQDGETRAAVKVIHAHLLARRGFFKRFLREAEIGRRVRHENVVATLDAGSIDIDGRDVRFLVMEYVEGRTLRALLDDLGRLPEALCRHVGRETARALAAIHAAGVVHRDLKPENVIVTADHVVKVMDLGVARLRDEAARISQTGTFVGSVRYAAPEQFRGGAATVDARADLYSLGLTLYEAATGAHPFADDDFHVVLRRQLSETPRPAGELNPQVSPFFEDLLARLVEKDCAKRIASAADLARILDEGEESGWWRDRSIAIRAATQRPPRRIRIPRETALYGRDVELAALRGGFEKAKAGDGQVLLIEGEAGIGKSRLVDEFVGTLAQSGEDVSFLFGSYPPGGAATASGAFSTAYREHLGDDEVAIRAALPQTPLLVPAFAALLRGDVAPDDAEKLTKDSLQTVFVHATRSFAAQRPTIVFIDDLHFAPEEGRALFASLALAVPGHRILLVGAARPGLDEKWLAQIERLEHATRLPLARLGTKDLVRLLTDSLRSAHLAEELAGRIGVKSDGNPFFVFEILRGLREGQFITKRSDGTWATTKEIRDIQVPSSVVELVQARVSDLSRADRNVLEVASCVGFEFDPAFVGDVLEIERIPLLQTLGAIEKSHRLVRSAGRRFVFDHHQVMEVLYAGLSEPLREEYHAAIGAAIEARSGAASRETKELGGALCVDLSEHFLKGAQGPKALRYLDPALKHLEANYLNDAAVRLADRALGVSGLIDGRARSELSLRTAAVLGRLGRQDAERSALDAARATAESSRDDAMRARVLGALGIHLHQLGQNFEAEARLREARDLARRVADLKMVAVATGDLGVVLLDLGRVAEAREQQETRLALSRTIGDRRGERTALSNLGGVLITLGAFEEARSYIERSLALAQEDGDAHGEAVATGNLGVLLKNLGRLSEAAERFERQITITRRIGHRRGDAFATGNLGAVFLVLSRFEEARVCSERRLAIAREIGDRWLEATAIGNLGVVLLAFGRYAEARRQFEDRVSISREIGDRDGEARSACNLASVCIDLGRLDEAQMILHRIETALEVGNPRQQAYLLHCTARILDEKGDAAAAERVCGQALQLRRELSQADGVAESLYARGALLSRLGRTAEALGQLEEALALARPAEFVHIEMLALARLASLDGSRVSAGLSALAAYERRAEIREALEARFLLWQATHHSPHLAEAKRLLDQLLAHAPPECRESMLANVRLHREIAAAAREQGLA